MHISNQKKTRNISEIAFQSWALQVSWFHNQRSSILFDLQTFLVSGHLLDLNESVFEVEEQSKKTLFFISSLFSQKLSIFSLLSFLSMSTNDHLLKTSHLKRESSNSLCKTTTIELLL